MSTTETETETDGYPVAPNGVDMYHYTVTVNVDLTIDDNHDIPALFDHALIESWRGNEDGDTTENSVTVHVTANNQTDASDRAASFVRGLLGVGGVDYDGILTTQNIERA